MKTPGIIACAILAGPAALASDRAAEEALKAAPAAVQSTVRENARGGGIEDFDRITIDGKTIYIAEIDRPDDLKIYVSENGALLKIREEVPVSQTPAAVLDAVRSLGGVIDEVEKEDTGKSTVYRVEIDRDGQPDLDVEVAPDGRILSRNEEADD